MLRRFAAGMTGLVMFVSVAIAADKEVKGKLVSVSPDDRKVTIVEDGKNVEFGTSAKGVVVTIDGKESKLGLMDKALVKGADVTLIIPATGKLVKGITLETKKVAVDVVPPKDVTKSPVTSAPVKTKSPATTAPVKTEEKGTAAIIVKVDPDKMTLTVKVDGKTIDLPIAESTKFVGPRGGDRGVGVKGLKDDVLAPGVEIHFMQNVKDKSIEEIHLPVRKATPK